MSKGTEARKQDMASALRASMKTEEDAIQDRFARAETVFSGPRGKAEAPSAPVESSPTPQRKVIRDTFSMPTGDYALVSKLRQRCLSYGIAATKSAIVRAGLHALNAMSESQVHAILNQLEQVKPGRPS